MNKLSAILSVLAVTCLQARAQFSYEIPFPKPISCPDDTVKMMIIGDVMMHSRQLEYDHTTFLSGIEDSMKTADICVANMEFPLGGKPYTGYPVFSTPDWYADYVADCGADVFLTANNHILDKGSAGMKRTLDYYSAMKSGRGVLYTGSGRDILEEKECNPLIVECKGIRIALVNFTYGTNSGTSQSWPRVMRMDEARLEDAMRRAEESDADFIIALPHWGSEYELNHNGSQQRWAEWLVENGADAVIGSHPHVVQDTTHIKGRPVIYSTGNAISNMSARNTRLELAVTLTFIRKFSDRSVRMTEPRIDFMWCTLPGMLTESYKTIYIKEWATRRSEWLNPSDYDNMIATLERVKAATGIED